VASSDHTRGGGQPPNRRTDREEIYEELIPEDQLPGANKVAELEPVPWRREDREWLEDRVRLIMTCINTGAFLTILVTFLISAHDGTPNKAWTVALATSSTSEAVVMRYYFTNKNRRS
jgi:hypothetical protein